MYTQQDIVKIFEDSLMLCFKDLTSVNSFYPHDNATDATSSFPQSGTEGTERESSLPNTETKSGSWHRNSGSLHW